MLLFGLDIPLYPHFSIKHHLNSYSHLLTQRKSHFGSFSSETGVKKVNDDPLNNPEILQKCSTARETFFQGKFQM